LVVSDGGWPEPAQGGDVTGAETPKVRLIRHTLPARHVIIAELDATIRRAELRVGWRRVVLTIKTALKRDAPGAETLLRRAEDRLTSLRGDRQYLFGAGVQ